MLSPHVVLGPQWKWQCSMWSLKLAFWVGTGSGHLGGHLQGSGVSI